MNLKDYIIDFERVNELTSTKFDDPDDKSNPFSECKYMFSVSRKLIREYLDVIISKRKGSISGIHSDKLEHVINKLEYNGILISKSEIRDRKISKVLESE